MLLEIERATGTRHATGTTFSVADVAPANGPLPLTLYRDAIDNLLEEEKHLRGMEYRPVEACSDTRHLLVDRVRNHPLMTALRSAYAQHRPICLSPDMIWLLICQGVAHHINANAETLRSSFVAPSGQAELRLRRDDFSKGSPDNPWPEVFTDFSRQLRDRIGPAHELFIPSFSTTGPTERAAAEVVLIGANQRYFHYAVEHFICGIPAVTLEGTPADWQRIVDGAERFAAVLDLGWWLAPLRPFLREFVSASRGQVDRDVWQSIYRVSIPNIGCHPGSGMGWIYLFFPYLTGEGCFPTRRNPLLSDRRDADELAEKLRNLHQEEGFDQFWFCSIPEVERGLLDDALPTGLVRAPFALEEKALTGALLRSWKMEMLAGFVGIAQHPETLCLRPEIGWAVREAPTARAASAATL